MPNDWHSLENYSRPDSTSCTNASRSSTRFLVCQGMVQSCPFLGINARRAVRVDVPEPDDLDGCDPRTRLDLGALSSAAPAVYHGVSWIFHRSLATILAWPRSAEMSFAVVEAARNTSDATGQPPTHNQPGDHPGRILFREKRSDLSSVGQNIPSYLKRSWCLQTK